MPPLGMMVLAVAVDQHRFWVSALKVPPFLTSMSTATRVVPLGCWFILIPVHPERAYFFQVTPQQSATSRIF